MRMTQEKQHRYKVKGQFIDRFVAKLEKKHIAANRSTIKKIMTRDSKAIRQKQEETSMRLRTWISICYILKYIKSVESKFKVIKNDIDKAKREMAARKKIQNFFLKRLYGVAARTSKGYKLPPYSGPDEDYVRSPFEKREILKLRKYVVNLVHLRTIHDSIKYFAEPYRGISNTYEARSKKIVTKFLEKNIFKIKFLTKAKAMIDKMWLVRDACKEFVKRRRHQKEILEYYWDVTLQRYYLLKKQQKGNDINLKLKEYDELKKVRP